MNVLNQPCSATIAEIDHDAYRDAQDVIEAQREEYADGHNWTLDAEATMRGWTDAEWAEQLQELPPSRLAAIARYATRGLTDWIPGEAGSIADEIWAKDALQYIRTNQSDLARRHYIETGEL